MRLHTLECEGSRHNFVDAFENQVMPVRAQAKELPEVGHVIFQDCVHDPWLETAIASTELYVSLSLLYDHGLLLSLEDLRVHLSVEVVAPSDWGLPAVVCGASSWT